MDGRVWDGLSQDGLYSVGAAVPARIRLFRETSVNGTPNQPNLSHGDWAPTQPKHVPSTIQDGGMERRFHHQEDLETISQTPGHYPLSSGFPQVSAGLTLGNQANQEMGPGRDLFPAQPFVAKTPALVQPEQTWAGGPAASPSIFEYDCLAPENPQSCSVGWSEVSQWQGRGEASVADWDASQLYPAENNSTWQCTSTASRTSSSSVGGCMRWPAALGQQTQHHAEYLLGTSRSLTETDALSSDWNRTRPLKSGAFVGGSTQQLGILSQQFQSFAAYDQSMDGGLTNLGDSMTPAALIGNNMRSPPSRGTTQAKKRAHNADNNKRKNRRFPDNNQKYHAILVRENGGACARCAKQHNKCRINPQDPGGPCLTCRRLATTLDKQLQCFRGKIMGAVFFRHYVDSDYGRPKFSESFKIGIGILKPLTGWDAGGKEVELTRGFGPTIRFRVLRAILNQADISESQRYIYECPWALEDFPGAVEAFRGFLCESISKEVTNKIKWTEDPLDQVTVRIFSEAYELATRLHSKSFLLQKVLMLWTGSRLIELDWYFHGSETLGRQTNNEGKVTLTAAPILDSEVSSIIVKHHLQNAQELVSEAIQGLLDGNKSIRKQHMYELFLTYFILLHNCECTMKHQRNWAKHNSSPFLYTPKMMVLVKGLLHTVNTILHVWRSDLKGQSPFSSDWQPDRAPKIAEFAENQYIFIQWVGEKIKGYEAHFNQLFQSRESYGTDYCFTGQLFVRDFSPMPDMPERPPAPRYGPGY